MKKKLCFQESHCILFEILCWKLTSFLRIWESTSDPFFLQEVRADKRRSGRKFVGLIAANEWTPSMRSPVAPRRSKRLCSLCCSSEEKTSGEEVGGINYCCLVPCNLLLVTIDPLECPHAEDVPGGCRPDLREKRQEKPCKILDEKVFRAAASPRPRPPDLTPDQQNQRARCTRDHTQDSPHDTRCTK